MACSGARIGAQRLMFVVAVPRSSASCKIALSWPGTICPSAHYTSCNLKGEWLSYGASTLCVCNFLTCDKDCEYREYVERGIRFRVRLLHRSSIHHFLVLNPIFAMP